MTDEPTLTLSDALKLSGMVRTGGEAKHLIQQGHVKVNGDVVTARKRKLKEGDEVELDGEVFVIERADEESEPPPSA